MKSLNTRIRYADQARRKNALRDNDDRLLEVPSRGTLPQHARLPPAWEKIACCDSSCRTWLEGLTEIQDDLNDRDPVCNSDAWPALAGGGKLLVRRGVLASSRSSDIESIAKEEPKPHCILNDEGYKWFSRVMSEFQEVFWRLNQTAQSISDDRIKRKSADAGGRDKEDRKSTRLNSSHG